jgi:general stress protein YciG
MKQKHVVNNVHPPQEDEDESLALLDDVAAHTELTEELKEALKLRYKVADKLPMEYLQSINRQARRQRSFVRELVETYWPILRKIFSSRETRLIIEADCFTRNLCAVRTLLQYLPDEGKEQWRMEVGRKGGRASYAAKLAQLEDSQKQKIGLHQADQETRDRVAQMGGLSKTTSELSKAGKKGGKTTMDRYGEEFYEELGRKDEEPELEIIEEDYFTIKGTVLELDKTVKELDKKIRDAAKKGYDSYEIKLDKKTGKLVSVHFYAAIENTAAA